MVLPGVGAFDDCINALRKQELLEAASDFIRTGKPFLGICVGYQALFERSEEFNSCAAGLGIFQGQRRPLFTEKPGLKIPQIGWNQIEIAKTDCPLLPRHRKRQLRLFRPQLLSAAGGPIHRRHAHGLRRQFCVVRLARQCLRHAISPGKKPESRPATAEEFCGVGDGLMAALDFAINKLRPLQKSVFGVSGTPSTISARCENNGSRRDGARRSDFCRGLKL